MAQAIWAPWLTSKSTRDRLTLVQQKAACNTLASHVMALQVVLLEVLRWEVKILELPLKSGLKALIMVRNILPLRIVCTASKALVDTIDIAVLLQQTMSNPYKTVEYHNRSLKLSDGCVKVVEAMRRFRRSYVRQKRSLGDVAAISTSFDQGGRLKSVGKGLVSHLHVEWNLTMNSVAQWRTTIPRRPLGKLVAKMLLGKRVPHRISNWTTLNRRSASEPRIDSGQSRRVRSRSLSRLDT